MRYHRDPPVPRRTPRLLPTAPDRSPPGCFVSEEESSRHALRCMSPPAASTITSLPCLSKFIVELHLMKLIREHKNILKGCSLQSHLKERYNRGPRNVHHSFWCD